MRDEDKGRVEDLWTRFLAHESLSADERADLAAALERDEVLRRRLVQDLQLEGVLRAAGEIERGQEHVVAQVQALVTAHGRTEEVVAAVRHQLEAKVAARRWAIEAAAAPSRRTRVVRWLTATALVATGAAAVVLLRPRLDPTPTAAPQTAQRSRGRFVAPGGRGDFYRAPIAAPGTSDPRPRPIVARLESIDGPAYRHGPDGIRRAAPSLDIAEGDWVSTSGGGARARLEGPGGSRLEIAGEASVGITAAQAETTAGASGSAGTAPGRPQAAPAARRDVRLFLAHGKATAVLPPARGAGPALVVSSPHAIVSGEGTIRLDVASASTRVEVREGRARVSALGVQRGTDVTAGQLAMVSAEDLQPPRAVNAPREALLLIGPDDTKEAPAPPGVLRGSEELLKSRLERLGFQVHVADAGVMTPERARLAALIVFSSSVNSRQLRPWFSELPVPMLVLESTGFERLGLTGTVWRRDLGPAPPVAEVVIQNPEHPVAAGLSGNVRVLSGPLNLRWAVPPAGATSIAGHGGGPAPWSLLFAYDRDAPTATGIAPARRVGLFLGNGRVIRALTDQGWRLFDAAALWSAGN